MQDNALTSDPDATVLVVGLGPIGGGIASRLAELGCPVVGLDLDGDRRHVWSVSSGAVAVSTVAAVPAHIGSVAIAVRTTDQALSAIHDVVSTLQQPVPIVLLTTVQPSDLNTLATVADNFPIIEMSVSGGAPAARAGKVIAFLADPSQARPRWIGLVSDRVFEFEQLGQPAAAKLLNNTLACANAAALAYVVDAGRRLGLSPVPLLDLLSASSGQSWIGDNLSAIDPELLWKDFGLLRRTDPQFAMPRFERELDFVDAVAELRTRAGALEQS